MLLLIFRTEFKNPSTGIPFIASLSIKASNAVSEMSFRSSFTGSALKEYSKLCIKSFICFFIAKIKVVKQSYKPFSKNISTLIQKRVQWISIHFNM